MAATSYTYTIATDIPSGVVSVARLRREIELSAIVTQIDYNAGGISAFSNGTLVIWFKDPLTSGEKEDLDGSTSQTPNSPATAGSILGDHTGDALPDDPQLVEVVSGTITIDSPVDGKIRSPDGTVFLGDATNPIRINPTGTTAQPITAASLPLPADAATQTTLAAVETNTDSLDVLLSTRATEATLVAIEADTDNLDVLLSTRATEATLASVETNTDNLDVLLSTRATEATLSTLNNKVPTQGQATMAASTPVVIASNQSTLPTSNAANSQVDGHSATLGTTSDADTANTVIGRLKQLVARLPSALVSGRLDSNIGAWLGSTTPTVGQKAMTACVPVALASDQTAVPAKIEDGSGSGRLAAVDGSNRLLVSANATVVPPAATPVEISEISVLTGTADTVYVIPNTKVLTITRFAGGAEGNSGKRSKVELFYDPAGTGTGMTLLRSMYLGGTNYEFGLDYKATGDGTRAIRMRRTRLDGASDEVAGFWSGYRDV